MTAQEEIQAAVDAHKAQYLAPHPWIKAGQRVRHRVREIYATVSYVGPMKVTLRDLDIRDDHKSNVFLEMQSMYTASIFEMAVAWEAHDPKDDGDRFSRARGIDKF